MNSAIKALLIGCGVLVLIAVVGAGGLFIWLMMGPEGGVKLGNEMDEYAIEYISDHQLLEEGEEILAYYDATLSMDGTEAAILTPSRVIYHKGGRSTTIAIGDVRDVRHRVEPLIGDVIEIESRTGQVMKIEIAPLNQGETFANVLMSTWRAATTP